MGVYISSIFGLVSSSPEEVAASVLDLTGEAFEGELSFEYAKVRYNKNKNDFEFYEEESDLEGRDDLLARLVRDGAGMWTCQLDLQFAPSEVDFAVFVGPGDNVGTTLICTFEKELTSYLTDYNAPRASFATVLARIADRIGADSFVAGAEIETWLPLPGDVVTACNELVDCPYVVGWREGAVGDEAAIASSFRVSPSSILRSTYSFRFVLLFPEV